MPTSDKDRRGIEVCKKFAPHFPLPIAMNSIQKREPPEPDILCCLEDGTKIAFELVEIIDESLARGIFSANNLKCAFDDHLDNLPTDVKAQFKQRYGNALIYIAFEDEVSITKRTNSVPKIFEFLLTLDGKIEGKHTLSFHKDLGKAVRWVNISRGRFTGPRGEKGTLLKIITYFLHFPHFEWPWQ